MKLETLVTPARSCALCGQAPLVREEVQDGEPVHVHAAPATGLAR